jgi:prepilin-type N-terminal cleavage/methylation domain-containing protein
VPERSPSPSGVARRAREQAGFTLIEVLIVALLLGAVMVPIMNGLVFEGNQTPVDTSYAQAIGQETAGLQQMVQEIRQAYAIESTNGDPSSGQGSYIDFLTMIYSASSGTDLPYEVRYDCGQVSPTNSSYHACLRYACQGSAYDKPCTLPSTSTNAVVDRVLATSPPVFTFRDRNGNAATNAQDIWTVEGSVQVPAHGSLSQSSVPSRARSNGLAHAVTLDNQTNLPNLQNGT